MPRKLLRYSLTALAMLLLPVVPANAQKEQFVRTKPHVNVGMPMPTTTKIFLGRSDGRVQQIQSTSKGLTTKKGSQRSVGATPAVQLYRYSP